MAGSGEAESGAAGSGAADSGAAGARSGLANNPINETSSRNDAATGRAILEERIPEFTGYTIITVG